MRPFQNPAVAATFTTYPEPIRAQLMQLRELIFDTAAEITSVGQIEEALRWGEPAYITSASKSGTPIRIAWKAAAPQHYALYVHCQTNLVATFRTLFPALTYEGNRAIVFHQADTLPSAELRECIARALTYHRRRYDVVGV
jgi:hypothetical protein